MIQRISSPVSVNLLFNHKTHQVMPQTILWEGRPYYITKVGLHHTYREGTTLYHVFSVATNTLFFRLVFNTNNLHWRVEEISDGEPD